MKFQITRGIPLPQSRGKPRKYDLKLEEMEVDDHLRYRHKNPTKKFTVRQVGDGVGIWRLSVKDEANEIHK